MTDPAIYIVNIKQAAKDLQELVAFGEVKQERMNQILTIAQEVLEDAKSLRVWAESQK